MNGTVRKINPCKMYVTTKPAVLFDSVQAFSVGRVGRVGNILSLQLGCSQGLKEATLIFL